MAVFPFWNFTLPQFLKIKSNPGQISYTSLSPEAAVVVSPDSVLAGSAAPVPAASVAAGASVDPAGLESAATKKEREILLELHSRC